MDEDEWWLYLSLKMLDLSSNVLIVIPSTIQSLTDLSVLNVSYRNQATFLCE